MPRILLFSRDSTRTLSCQAQLEEHFEVVTSRSIEDGLRLLQQQAFDGVCVLGAPATDDAAASGLLLQAGGLLSQLPDGLALVDVNLNLLWSNPQFREFTRGSAAGDVGTPATIYQLLGSPEILGPDFSPLHSALGNRITTRSQLKLGDKSFLLLTATPVIEPGAGDAKPRLLIVSLRDISSEVLQQQKMNAVYQAGLELGELTPQDLLDMSVQDRVELLKSKITHYTQDLLEFESIEIRLLDKPTKRLDSLLVVGMCPEAATRELFASPEGNGVTGFVAATGKSYLCEDTSHDPLYLVGALGAHSSLTVPLILHDQILGTINVEGSRPGAFTEADLQFLELFSREIAVALNTLELLVVEKNQAVTRSAEKILHEVAGPVDEVLNDAAWILEKFIGHDPEVVGRLQDILKHTRNIKQQVQKVGESVTPAGSHGPVAQRPQRPKLRGKRILVADNDETVRQAAHEVLARYGCEVETAHHGDEALLMVRTFAYDAVLVDIRLPDMTGYECFCQIREHDARLPIVFMTGFGYDPGHSIVKARQQGLKSVLYKPFRLDQLLDELEKNVSPPVEVTPPAGTQLTTAPTTSTKSSA
ncbi:MAG: response regulator [Planctomycetales bacterium]|nr:response regulator [Planctomycetales bacterium]